ADWVVNNTNHNLVAETQCNRDAKMRNAIEIIHGAIKRIDDPLVLAGLITYDSFFAIKRVFWKFFEKQLRNQFLCLNIDLQLDIVRCDSIHSLRAWKIFAKRP